MDRRPTVFEEMQVEEQPSHSTVAVAEGMNGLEVEMHPGAEAERILSVHVSLFVLLFPRRHHVQDPFHSRRRTLHAPDPDVYPPPLTGVRLDAPEHFLIKTQQRAHPERSPHHLAD